MAVPTLLHFVCLFQISSHPPVQNCVACTCPNAQLKQAMNLQSQEAVRRAKAQAQQAQAQGSPPMSHSSFCLLSTSPAARGPSNSTPSHGIGMALGQVTLPNHRHARISGIFDRETIVINVDGTIVALMTT